MRAAVGVNRPFIGTIEGNRFRIRRDIGYRNSFLPIVSGQIVSATSGVRVSVTMGLHLAVAIVMLVWFAGVGFATAGSLWLLLTNRASAAFGFLIPPAMLVFGVVLVAFGFFPEAIKARTLLEQILSTQPATLEQE